MFDLNRKNIGLTFLNDNFSEFLLWAPFAKSVELVVQEKDFSLQPIESGYWKLKTNEIKPGERYKIRLDKKKTVSRSGFFITTRRRS